MLQLIAICLLLWAEGWRRTMRYFIYIVMLVGVASLLDGHSSFAASSPPKISERQVESYVYVRGGVRKPGRYDWRKGMTVIDAIHTAGGFTDSAARKVWIVHLSGANVLYACDSTNAPPIVEVGDRISVPRRLL